MRTLSEEVTIPLAAIDTVAVRRYLLVRAGGVKYICPAISRSLRKTVRNEMKWQGGSQMLAPGLRSGDSGPVQTEVKGSKGVDYADFVETQIMQLAERRPPRPRDRGAVRGGVRARLAGGTPSGLARDRGAVRARGRVRRLRPGLTQIPAAALMSSRRASSRAAAEMRAASTPASGSTGTTTSR